jgi:hypothetical protein
MTGDVRAGAFGVLCALLCLYSISVLISAYIMRARAGAGVWHRLKVFGDDGFGLGWVLTIVLASMVWPITLILWLARGRPEPRIVFNEKAEERRRRSLGASR